MAKLNCLISRHKTLDFNDEEYCITCLESRVCELEDLNKAMKNLGNELVDSLGAPKSQAKRLLIMHWDNLVNNKSQ